MMNLVILALVCGLGIANAHTYLSSVTINGVKQSDCLRPLGTNSPLTSVTGPEMMCGFLPAGAKAANSKCTIAAGDKIGLQWNHNNADPGDDIIDPSHKGPCMIYLSSDNGANWFKIYEMGYSTTTDWCVIDLISKKGYMEATIPSDITAGSYLIRGEIIALHEAGREGGAQPYVDCAELQITGGGNAKPATVKFPGAYTPTDPGILFNIYTTITQYVIPGPPVYRAGAIISGGGGSGNGNSGNGNGGGSGNGNSGNGDNNNAGDNTGNNDQEEPKGKKNEGMSVGGQAALALFLIAMAAGIAGGVYFYNKNGQLMGYKLDGYKVVKHRPAPEEFGRGGNYVAYEDNL